MRRTRCTFHGWTFPSAVTATPLGCALWALYALLGRAGASNYLATVVTVTVGLPLVLWSGGRDWNSRRVALTRGTTAPGWLRRLIVPLALVGVTAFGAGFVIKQGVLSVAGIGACILAWLIESARHIPE
jgi:hypothetical protein